jgi:hypothetical protein
MAVCSIVLYAKLQACLVCVPYILLEACITVCETPKLNGIYNTCHTGCFVGHVNREDEEERIRNAGGFIVHKVTYTVQSTILRFSIIISC